MRNAYLELTKACSLDCIFCSLGGNKKSSHKLSDMKDFLKRCRAEGYKKLFITGGEPLVYEKLEEVVTYAVELGFAEVTVQTNGIYMTKKKARSLKSAGLGQAIFSIHSHDPAMEDALMSGVGILEKQLGGLMNAHNVGLDTPVTVVIVQQNYKMLPDFIRFMVEKYPFVRHYTFNFVDPVGRARDNKEVVPRISHIEPFLMRSLAFLVNEGKTFRIERVPLCYILEFSEYSTELRRIVTKEANTIMRRVERVSHNDDYFKEQYVRGDACCTCWIKEICPGVKKGYADLYGTEEIFPVFVKPETIVSRAGGD